MRALRFALISIAVFFAIGFGLPAVFHRLTCESFVLSACTLSPYPRVLGFLAEHRSVWLLSAVAYASAVVLVFRGELLSSFAGMRFGLQARLVLALAATLLCALAFALLSE